MRIKDFQQTVWQHYDQAGRHTMPWRLPDTDGNFSPYKIMVSEVMLQQTQVARVIVKYQQFLTLFPTVADLAKAELGQVLTAWQGLGYNRRAKFLWQAAKMVETEFAGVFPDSQKNLTRLPGVGFNTAGAIMAYAHNQPVSFIETNIRTVFIHHFFHDQHAVPDQLIMQAVTNTLPSGSQAPIRQWYWALMDYGAHLKQTVGNLSRASKSYAKQSPFTGSRRAVRGAVIRLLSQQDAATTDELANYITDPRLEDVLKDLEAEGLIRQHAKHYRLS